ncbi:MAG: MFS transporter, partial [Myxococcota bacterium]
LVRWAGPITAAWFALAAIPTFVWVRDRSVPKPLPAGKRLGAAAFGAIVATAREAGRYRDLAVFLVSHFFAMAGLSIVVSFAFIYGDQVIGWSAGTQAAMFALTQVSATVGAVGFGWFQGRLGDKATYAITLAVWCVAVGLIRFNAEVSDLVRTVSPTATSEQVFLGTGVVAGMCMGATQSAARTLVALLSPPDKVGEFFGLWGMFGKLAAVVGLMSLGALQATFGLADAIGVTGLFFALGLAVVAFVDVPRGQRAATRLEG